MTKTKHTPGPWHYVCGSVWTTPEGSDDAGACIAQRAGVGAKFKEPIEPTTKDANMRLIAAAPELLAALVEFSGVWERGETFADMDVDAIESMRRRARAAIAKATGETK